MLGKPLSHLRPLLRLQNHAQPDLFTSNPSLLHHFPQQGGHAVVQAGPSAAQAAGQNAGNAGRAGWGGGAGAGGNGYTGHARAFLGIPQTTTVDPSSGLNDDTKDQERAMISHQRRFQAARFSQTQVLSGTIDGGNVDRRRIEGREGGLLRAIALEDAQEVRSIDPEVAARYIAAGAGEMMPRPTRRRGSIAYPQPTPALALNETPSRPASSGRRELVRSSSSMDVWIGSSITSRPQLRTFSTRTPTIPLPDLIDEASLPADVVASDITPSPSSRTRIIPQPNHVLMDLAGRDLPPSSSITRRYNSSLATQARPEIFDDLTLPPPSRRAPPPKRTPEEQADYEKGQQIYQMMRGLTLNITGKEKNRDQLVALVAHYRSSRQLAPLDPRQVPGDPALVQRFPLPSGYDVGHYNACLEALMALRLPGESIARILEAYNEMLERDVVPNMRTYQSVIQALCARESDVWSVVQRWQREKQWAQWRCEQMGEVYQDDQQQSVRDKLVEGYMAEGNLDSALRLFSAARTFQNNSHWSFQPLMYHVLLKTIATQSKPNLRALREVFDHAVSRQARGIMGLYRFVLEALGRAGRADELAIRWAEFKKAEEAGHGALLSHWMDGEFREVEGSDETARRIIGAKMITYQAAIKHFARLGMVDKAEEIVREVEEKVAGEGQIGVADAYGNLILGISLRDVDAGVAKLADLEPKIKAGSLGRLPLTETMELVDLFVAAGKWREATSILPRGDTLKSGQYAGADYARTARLYQAIIIDAKRASTADEARDILKHLDPLMKDSNFNLGTFPIADHFALLQQHGLWTEAAPALKHFRRDVDRADHLGWLETFVDAAISHLSAMELLQLYSAATGAGKDVRSLPHLRDVLVDKYVADRAADPAAWSDMLRRMVRSEWAMLWEITRRLDGERFTEGGYDDFLAQSTEDIQWWMRSGKMQSGDYKARAAIWMGKHASCLVYRFGEERAKVMMEGIELPANYDWTPASQVKLTSESRATTPSSEPTLSDFSLPSPPTSFTTVSPPPPTSTSSPGPQYLLNRDLSQTLDSHMHRNPRMTTEGAYNLIYQELANSRRVPHPGSIGRLLNTIGRDGDEEKVNNLYALAQSILEHGGIEPNLLPKMWAEVEDHMLIASCHLGHLERAGTHRQRIIDAGMVPTANAYATMIASSKDTTDDASVARALFDESQRMGVVPNLYLYNTIISKLSRARKAELALELFAHMKAAGIDPSSVTYGAIINACCRVGDAQSAETLFSEMRNHRYFKPRVPPYNTMMQFFIHNSPSRAKVLQYHSLLRQDRVPPSAHTYKLLMDAYSTLPPIDLVAMERVYADLLADHNVKPQATHIASLITAYGMYGDDLAKAMEIFESPPGQSGSRRTHDAIVWEAILNVVAHKGTLADLEAMRQRMSATGIQPTAYVYNVLIAGYARAQQMDEARRIFDSMGDSVTGVAAPNNHPVLLTGAGYAKPQTMTEEPTTLVYREPSTYEAMVRAEMSAGESEKALEVLGRMEARGYPWAVFMRVKAVVEDASMAGLQGAYSRPPST